MGVCRFRGVASTLSTASRLVMANCTLKVLGRLTGKLYGKIQWRIEKGNGDFLERNTVQTFKQQVCTSRSILAKCQAHPLSPLYLQVVATDNLLLMSCDDFGAR